MRRVRGVHAGDRITELICRTDHAVFLSEPMDGHSGCQLTSSRPFRVKRDEHGHLVLKAAIPPPPPNKGRCRRLLEWLVGLIRLIFTCKCVNGRTGTTHTLTNGVEVSGKPSGKQFPKKHDPEKESRVWHVPCVPRLARITVKGAGSLRIDSPALLGERLTMYVKGSGSLSLCGRDFITTSASTQGSGNIRFDEVTEINSLTAVVRGSGSISGFRVRQNCFAGISGSGDILGTSLGTCVIEKQVRGSGHIGISSKMSEDDIDD